MMTDGAIDVDLDELEKIFGKYKMCIDMCVDMCIGMCTDMCIGMCVDMWTDM